MRNTPASHACCIYATAPFVQAGYLREGLASLLARGRVIQASKLLTVARADVFSCREGRELLCANMLATARNLAPAQ